MFLKLQDDAGVARGDGIHHTCQDDVLSYRCICPSGWMPRWQVAPNPNYAHLPARWRQYPAPLLDKVDDACILQPYNCSIFGACAVDSVSCMNKINVLSGVAPLLLDDSSMVYTALGGAPGNTLPLGGSSTRKYASSGGSSTRKYGSSGGSTSSRKYFPHWGVRAHFYSPVPLCSKRLECLGG